MLDLTWRRSALAQLDTLTEYIAARNPNAAQRIKALIEHHVALARVVPGMGRPGRVAGTRELIAHPNYIIIYRATETEIVVLRVLHAHQQYP
jgi:toxin ParE1/3/4